MDNANITELVLVICLGLLVLVNIGMIILRVRSMKKNGEVVLDVDDYLTLILQQIDQLAGDAIKLATIRRSDFDDDDSYSLALLALVKERVMECGEEYGLSSNILKLIDQTKLENYLLDSINMIVKKNEVVKEEAMTEAEIVTATTEQITSSETPADSNPVLNAINDFYQDTPIATEENFSKEELTDLNDLFAK